jgi:hypothetical protein
MNTKAAFSLEYYLFDKVNINLENYNENEYGIEFSPKGKFDKEKNTFTLNFGFTATCDGIENSFVPKLESRSCELICDATPSNCLTAFVKSFSRKLGRLELK